MIKGYLLDTNIFLRLLLSDHSKQTPAIINFFEELVQKKRHGYVTVVTLLEIGWTLDSFYELSRDGVAQKLRLILNTPNLVVEDRVVVERMMQHFEQSNADLVDCYNGAFAEIKGSGDVLSYDRHFDKLTGVTRHTPNDLKARQ